MGYKRYSDEQIDRANDTNIIQVAQMYGYHVETKNKETRIPDMGGLVINKSKNTWYCFNLKQGGGPIQFLMQFENMSWVDSVETILNEEGNLDVIRTENIKPEVPKEFILPEANHSYHHVFAYLIKTRKIHPHVIQKFVHEGLIYESKQYHSCVFVGKDGKGDPRYATLRGTYTQGKQFKGEVKGSNKQFGFNRVGTGNTLFIAEAPIDVLSYLSIYYYRGLEKMVKTEHLLSLGCTADNALEQYLCEHPEVTNLKLGLDNDAAGNDGCKKIFEKYSGNYNIKRINMKQKDMNEVLQEDLEKLLSARQERELIKQEEEQEQELELEVEL